MTRLMIAPILLAASLAAGCAGSGGAASAAGTGARAPSVPREDPLPTVRLAQVPGWPAELAGAESSGGFLPSMLLDDCLSMLNRAPFGGAFYIFGASVTDDGVHFHAARNNGLMPNRAERFWCTWSARLGHASIAPADIEDTGPGGPPFVALSRDHLPDTATRVAALGDLGSNGLVIGWSE